MNTADRPRPADLRVTYAEGTFEPTDLAEHPLAQFERWFHEAIAAKIDEPNAMVLATADHEGKPSSRTVLLKGVVYTLGRAFTYTLIGLLFYFGLGESGLSGFFQRWGEKILGPLLIVIGLFMLGVVKMNLPGIGRITEKMEHQAGRGYWGVFLLGLVFALAFCPYSGVLYFVMLIPMTVASAQGLYLPLVFAVATGLPVILFAWMIAYAVGSVGTIYNKIKVFELWFRRVVAVLFIGVGIYYVFATLIL